MPATHTATPRHANNLPLPTTNHSPTEPPPSHKIHSHHKPTTPPVHHTKSTQTHSGNPYSQSSTNPQPLLNPNPYSESSISARRRSVLVPPPHAAVLVASWCRRSGTHAYLLWPMVPHAILRIIHLNKASPIGHPPTPNHQSQQRRRFCQFQYWHIPAAVIIKIAASKPWCCGLKTEEEQIWELLAVATQPTGYTTLIRVPPISRDISELLMGSLGKDGIDSMAVKVLVHISLHGLMVNHGSLTLGSIKHPRVTLNILKKFNAPQCRP
uniref:Uncharacterized protein n=1 Tax=Fagus sylvatica TaxID=28930 RepID=A0A2N9FBZ2_FAGSY